MPCVACTEFLLESSALDLLLPVTATSHSPSQAFHTPNTTSHLSNSLLLLPNSNNSSTPTGPTIQWSNHLFTVSTSLPPHLRVHGLPVLSLSLSRSYTSNLLHPSFFHASMYITSTQIKSNSPNLCLDLCIVMWMERDDQPGERPTNQLVSL